MSQEIRYIFGCNHEKRSIKSSVYFENGFELPSMVCTECTDFCDICLEKSETDKLDKLNVCKKCFSKIQKS